MRDIVERLKDSADQHPLDAPMALFTEAAIEIARLRGELRKIRDLEMGRGDGAMGDYVEDIHQIASAALPPEGA